MSEEWYNKSHNDLLAKLAVARQKHARARSPAQVGRYAQRCSRLEEKLKKLDAWCGVCRVESFWKAAGLPNQRASVLELGVAGKFVGVNAEDIKNKHMQALFDELLKVVNQRVSELPEDDECVAVAIDYLKRRG